MSSVFSLIDDFESLNHLITRFQKKNTYSNNYFLIQQFVHLIEEKKLYLVIGHENLYLLVDRGISFQVYFHVNDLAENVDLSVSKPLMMEIVYRGLSPEAIKSFWIRNGFKEHLTRNNLLLVSKDIKQFDLGEGIVKIKFAETCDEAKKITTLFQTELDTYTSDAKSLAEITEYVNHKNVLCAYIENEFGGALQFEWKQNNCWLGHIAVDDKFRGKGLANRLVAEYISINAINENAKFQLWVINDNLPAINLYTKFGFRYTGKSTVSLLRI